MENSFETRIELPASNALEKDCKWVSPEFHPSDTIVETNLWSMRGMAAAIGYLGDKHQKVIGSGVMVAPGLCLTATHVLEGLPNLPVLASFADQESMRMWVVEDVDAPQFRIEFVPFQITNKKFSDVAVVSCSPFSRFTDNEPYHFAPIEVVTPKIGERLWAVGYREQANDGVPTIGCFLSSGVVSELYLQGRGSHIKGPCIEVKMTVFGGMSGGPVFNAAGRIVGVISSGLAGDQNAGGTTYVSLVWPTLLSKVRAPWPDNYWPDRAAGLQVKTEHGGVRVLGSAERDENGIIRIKFSGQSDTSMLKTLVASKVCTDADDLSDVAYDMFSEYLETEGLDYLATLKRSTFAELVSDKVPSDLAKLFVCAGVDCLEGMEDLDVKSITQLEDGSLGIHVTFNLRRVEMSVAIQKCNDELHGSEIEEANFFYDPRESADQVIYTCYIRPHYSVTVGLNTEKRRCDKIRVLALSLPSKRRPSSRYS